VRRHYTDTPLCNCLSHYLFYLPGRPSDIHFLVEPLGFEWIRIIATRQGRPVSMRIAIRPICFLKGNWQDVAACAGQMLLGMWERRDQELAAELAAELEESEW
jgi:hypothetical protein